MLQKRTATMMTSSKTRNYHICEILYNLYKDNIFQNKKYIKFFSITALSVIKDTANFSHCVDLIYAAVNPYHIVTLNKQLEKVEIKYFVMKLMRNAS